MTSLMVDYPSKDQPNYVICGRLNYLLLQISRKLIPWELVVFIDIDLLEDVDGLRALLRVDQLNVEVECGSTRNDISGSLITVTEG